MFEGFFGRCMHNIFGWTLLNFLILTLDLVGSIPSSAISLGWLIIGFINCGLETTFGLAVRPKWKLLKTDYQSTRHTMTIEHRLETLQLPPDALTVGMKLKRPGVWISVIFHIDLLTNEAIFTGWNPIGTEARLPISYHYIGAAGAQITLHLSP